MKEIILFLMAAFFLFLVSECDRIGKATGNYSIVPQKQSSQNYNNRGD